MPSSKAFGTWRTPYAQWPQAPGVEVVQKPSFGVGDIEGGLIIPNIGPEIRRLTKDIAPFTYLVAELRKEQAFDTQFRWVSDDYAPYAVLKAGAESSPGTSIALVTGHGARVRVNDILFVPRTGERMRVTAVSGDTLTVVRNWGSALSAPVALADQEVIINAGYAGPEGGTAPNPLRSTKRIMANYVQRFWRSWKQSGTSLNIKLITGETGERAYQERKMQEELQMEIERAFIFGVPVEDPTSGVHTTGGVLHLLGWRGGTTADCPVLDLNAGFSLGALVSWAKEVSFYDSSPRVLFASPELIQQIYNGLASLSNTPYRWNASVTDDRFKLGWSVLDLGFLELRIVKCHTLKFDGTASGSGVAGNRRVRGFAVPMDNLAYVVLGDRDGVRFETPIPNQLQEDAYKVSVLHECGLKLWHPETFGIVLG
jgi:hypothetical protein